MLSQAVVGEQGVQQRAEDTHPWGGPCVKSQCGGVFFSNSHSLWSARQEFQDPVAEGGVQALCLVTSLAGTMVLNAELYTLR